MDLQVANDRIPRLYGLLSVVRVGRLERDEGPMKRRDDQRSSGG